MFIKIVSNIVRLIHDSEMSGKKRFDVCLAGQVSVHYIGNRSRCGDSFKFRKSLRVL